ncbi:Protein of unknown function [Pyronema omphalodes CBS 100304]|uniref:Uncharacterized protein n=1 Tax=Pyronema omphalodes (strain CBS 100304) TaxID=1076935 RepID=U4KUI9_PYROM|nr:Protein of unknown function [Pyronema omphalodes CBS 100304]
MGQSASANEQGHIIGETILHNVQFTDHVFCTCYPPGQVNTNLPPSQNCLVHRFNPADRAVSIHHTRQHTIWGDNCCRHGCGQTGFVQTGCGNNHHHHHHQHHHHRHHCRSSCQCNNNNVVINTPAGAPVAVMSGALASPPVIPTLAAPPAPPLIAAAPACGAQPGTVIVNQQPVFGQQINHPFQVQLVGPMAIQYFPQPNEAIRVQQYTGARMAGGNEVVFPNGATIQVVPN